jgi:Cu-processing system permease protein
MTTTLRIASYAVRDLARSRWLAAYAAFFAIATFALIQFSDNEAKAMLSLVNVVLLIVPLANVVFGTMYLQSSREFVELLLAQPIRRRQLFAGLYLGLAAPVSLAVVAGIGLPLVFMGASRETLATGAVLALMAAALGAVFTGIAAVVAYAFEDRVRGIVTAIGSWLLLAVVYDALVIMAATRLAEYPIERPMLAAMFANPIDLARLVMLSQFDVAALLGYTGALFQRFLGGASGFVVALTVFTLWATLPALYGARLFHRKDF